MEKTNIYGFSDFSDEEAREFISLLFDGYQKRKNEKRLYNNEDDVPEIIIKTYYNYVKKPDFSQVVTNFKKRYLYNENKMEDVHTKEERTGLALVYNYIQNKEDLRNISIYDLSFIHEELYSKTPYPEFGGKYRKDEAFLSGTRVELAPFWTITHEMNLLKPEVNALISEGLELGEKSNPEKLISYINRCIILKCKLIKIHPFPDGNGRSVRGFMNLLFRLANIPPVYVENREKDKYREAMFQAIVEEDYENIIKFYHFKICDSIMALDVEINEKRYEDESKKEYQKGVKIK